MSRPSLCRSARRGRLLLAALALANLFAFRAGAGESEECAPFESAYPASLTLAAAGDVREGGVAPSGGGEARAGGGGGAIVALPSGGAAASAEPTPGEALLALPKRSDGTLPTDFELGRGVRIAESYWSPVLCATVARLVGPPGASLAELVPRVPAGGAAAPHDVYSTAAVALRAAPPVALRAAPPVAAETAPAVPGTGSAPPAPDPYRSLQYGLDRLGADGAWVRSRGAGVRVALLDSAPEAAHRDLAGVSLAAIDGGPGTAPATHGTLMAGVLRAVALNGFGIAGVAPDAELIAVPVCTPAGASASDACRLFDVLRGVDRAWDLGAAVFNLSLVGPANPLLERAMTRLEKLGAVVVAAAGNEGTSEARYPAAYPSVIGVGAVGADGAPFARGNRGASAELLAPGVEVLSTVPGDAFAFGEGTSLAAAHVSGALALLVGAGAEPAAARTALFQSAEAARPAASSPASPPTLAPLCAALERLGKACAGAAAGTVLRN